MDGPLSDPSDFWDGQDRRKYIGYLSAREHFVQHPRVPDREDWVKWRFYYIPGMKDAEVRAYRQGSQGRMLPYSGLLVFNTEGLARLYAETNWQAIPEWIREGPTDIGHEGWSRILCYKIRGIERPDKVRWIDLRCQKDTLRL